MIATLGVLCPACGESTASNPQPAVELTQVQKDVERCVRALYSGDVDVVLDFTHPAILEKIGGRARAKSGMEEGFKRMIELEMQVESFSFPRAPDFLQGGKTSFAIVPTLTILSSRGMRAESLNYQVGVREQGASEWKYVEGSRINSANVHSIFPDFPSNYVFPEFYRKKL